VTDHDSHHNDRASDMHIFAVKKKRKLKLNIATTAFLFYMEKKIIFLELPTNIIERIDEQNMIGSRSIFISELLEKQLHGSGNEMHAAPETLSSMHAGELDKTSGEISLVNSKGVSLGRFDINTVTGFEDLTEKICTISDDPIVRMKARRMR